MQISASERSSVRSSGSLTAEMSGVCQLVPQNDRIIAVLFHILLDVLHRIDKVDPPADLVEHLVQNTLAGVSGCAAQRQPSCARTYPPHGPWTAAFRLQTAQILERLPDVLIRFGMRARAFS